MYNLILKELDNKFGQCSMFSAAHCIEHLRTIPQCERVAEYAVKQIIKKLLLFNLIEKCSMHNEYTLCMDHVFNSKTLRSSLAKKSLTITSASEHLLMLYDPINLNLIQILAQSSVAQCGIIGKRQCQRIIFDYAKDEHVAKRMVRNLFETLEALEFGNVVRENGHCSFLFNVAGFESSVKITQYSCSFVYELLHAAGNFNQSEQCLIL